MKIMKNRYHGLSIKKPFILLVMVTLACLSSADSGSSRLNITKTDQIIVRFKDTPTYANAIAFIKQGVTQGGFGVAVGKRRQVIKLGANLNIDDVKALARDLEKDPQIKFAEPDLLIHTMAEPNDPLYAEQWNFFEQKAGINLPAAWDITTGHTDIVIGVIDTGITNHNELDSHLLSGFDFISSPWMANDGDGWDPSPLDTGDYLQAGACGSANGNPVPANTRRSSWHGTHVTGTISAVGNNGDGVAGVLWQSTILPLRAIGRCGGYTSDITAAMRWAAGLPVAGAPINETPANVLNLSVGGNSLTCPQNLSGSN